MNIQIEEQPIPVHESPTPVVVEVPWRSQVWAAVWPKIIWLLAPVLALIRALLVFYTRVYIRVFRDTKISTQSKCPACGHRRAHTILYSPERRAVIHTCTVCHASWGETPIYPVANWSVGLVEPPTLTSRPIASPNPE